MQTLGQFTQDLCQTSGESEGTRLKNIQNGGGKETGFRILELHPESQLPQIVREKIVSPCVNCRHVLGTSNNQVLSLITSDGQWERWYTACVQPQEEKISNPGQLFSLPQQSPLKNITLLHDCPFFQSGENSRAS